MHNNYRKIKKIQKNKNVKTRYFVVVLIVVLLCIFCSYAYFQTTLKVKGSVRAYRDFDLPVEIPSKGKDSNGVNRYTSTTDFVYLGATIYKVVAEEYTDNEITTTIQQTRKSWLYLVRTGATITLTIPNNSNYDFTNGTVELIESKDDNSVFTSVNGTLTSTTVQKGSTVDVKIKGNYVGNVSVASNTHFKFRISFDVDGAKSYFYYNLIFKAM